MIKDINESSNLTTALSEVKAIAYQSMRYSAYLGHIIGFLERASATHTPELLLQQLRTTVENLGLTSYSISYDGINEKVYTGKPSTEMAAKMTASRWESRILEDGHNVYFNWENLTLLVSDMPIEDENSYGVYLDSLATLMNGADRRLGDICVQQVWDMGINHMYDLIDESKKNLEKDLFNYKEKVTELLEEMSFDLQETIQIIKLSTDQEDEIIELVADSVTKTHQQANKDLKLGGALDCIIFCIEELKKRNIHQYNEKPDDNGQSYNNTVELF